MSTSVEQLRKNYLVFIQSHLNDLSRIERTIDKVPICLNLFGAIVADFEFFSGPQWKKPFLDMCYQKIPEHRECILGLLDINQGDINDPNRLSRVIIRPNSVLNDSLYVFDEFDRLYRAKFQPDYEEVFADFEEEEEDEEEGVEGEGLA
jgi:hypothetical protein